LADPITASAHGEVDMDVVLVVAVCIWTEYGRETLANRRSYRNAEVFRYGGVGQSHAPTTFEPDGTNVEGVCSPVLAQLGSDDTILTAALEGIKSLDPDEDGLKVGGQADQILSNPIDYRFCRLAAKRSGRRNLNAKAVFGHYPLQRDDVGPAALARAVYRTKGSEHRAIGS
jgi:hypothetical protein